MRLVIQRVLGASVTINGNQHSNINQGLLLFVGIENNDNNEDIDWLCKKVINLRIFDDENKIPNKSIIDIDGELLVVSQFTLHALVKKGNRPSYIKAAKPEISIPLYEKFVTELARLLGKPVQSGVFGADMQVHLVNDGPITIWIDSKNRE